MVLLNSGQKATVVHPNGFLSFQELRVGEKLILPEEWFDGTLDTKPRSYFAALPHPDGVTPSRLGLAAAGILGDYAALDAASAKVGALAAMGDQAFSIAAPDVAAAIDSSVLEVAGTGSPAIYAVPYAQAVRSATSQALQRNVSLVAAIGAGDTATSSQTRVDILRDFSSALLSAKLALQAFHGGDENTTVPATIASVAQAAVTAIAADPNYCMSVAQPGSPVNAAVHALKTAWNAANPTNLVPINTGTYEQATADVLARVLGSAPAACATRTPPSLPGGGGSGDWVAPAQRDQGLSVGAILGYSLIGVGVVGGAIYLVTRKPAPKVRRVQPIRRIRREDTLGPWKDIP